MLSALWTNIFPSQDGPEVNRTFSIATFLLFKILPSHQPPNSWLHDSLVPSIVLKKILVKIILIFRKFHSTCIKKPPFDDILGGQDVIETLGCLAPNPLPSVGTKEEDSPIIPTPGGKLLLMGMVYLPKFTAKITLPKLNIAPEKVPSQWESSLPTNHFAGGYVGLREGNHSRL